MFCVQTLQARPKSLFYINVCLSSKRIMKIQI